MLRSNCSNPLRKKLGKTAAFCFVVIIASFVVQMPHAFGVFNARVIFFPDYAKYALGQDFTLTVNLTNFENLHAWQVALKYNGTVLNLTSIWVPPDNVFAGLTAIVIDPPVALQAAGDSKDGLNWTLYGSTLLGIDSVTVTNGVLFKANFTVMNVGETSINLATNSAPVFRNNAPAYWSDLMDQDLNSYDIFIPPEGCTILSGVSNATPTASFIVVPPALDLNMTYYVMDSNVPPGVSQWQRGYALVPVLFNASESIDPDGYITKYIWDFGDKNITTVNVNYNATGRADIDVPAGRNAALAAAAISHIYDITGSHPVTLIVVDNGNPDPTSYAPPTNSSKSDPSYVLVGLLLVPYDWNPFIYAVGAIVAVLIVLYAARKIQLFSRERRARARAKMTDGSQNQPPSGIKP